MPLRSFKVMPVWQLNRNPPHILMPCAHVHAVSYGMYCRGSCLDAACYRVGPWRASEGAAIDSVRIRLQNMPIGQAEAIYEVSDVRSQSICNLPGEIAMRNDSHGKLAILSMSHNTFCTYTMHGSMPRAPDPRALDPCATHGAVLRVRGIQCRVNSLASGTKGPRRQTSGVAGFWRTINASP